MYSSNTLRYFLCNLHRRLNTFRIFSEYEWRICRKKFSLSIMPRDFKGQYLEKIYWWAIYVPRMNILQILFLDIFKKLLYVYNMEYIILWNSFFLQYTIWDGISLKTISRYCPFKDSCLVRVLPKIIHEVNTKQPFIRQATNNKYAVQIQYYLTKFASNLSK